MVYRNSIGLGVMFLIAGPWASQLLTCAFLLLPNINAPLVSRRQSTFASATGGVTLQQSSNNNFERDLEERSRRKARGGAGETVAGALLGGLLLGPFGALFGAQIGAGLGANNALDRARKEEMERLGVTQEMLKTAQECGLALERSMEGLKATQDSLTTQQSFARMLDRDAEELYEKAKQALQQGNEERAKELLFQRTLTQDKLKDVLRQCADAKQRLLKMEDVAVIERRAKEVEALMQRTIAAKTTQDLSTMDSFSLAAEDPLLKKFRDAGID